MIEATETPQHLNNINYTSNVWEIGMVWIGLNRLRIGTSGGLL
jgi:hypothetical protein